MAKRFDMIPGVEWVETPGEFIRVQAEKCTGCGHCLKVCLGSCFQMRNNQARIKSLDTCMECGACWYVCEAGAIFFSWPKGGTGFRTDWG